MSVGSLAYRLDSAQRRSPHAFSDLWTPPFFASSTIKLACGLLVIAPPTTDSIRTTYEESAPKGYADQLARSTSGTAPLGATSVAGQLGTHVFAAKRFAAPIAEEHLDPLLFSVAPIGRELAPKVAAAVIPGDLPKRLDRFSVNLLPADFDD